MVAAMFAKCIFLMHPGKGSALQPIITICTKSKKLLEKLLAGLMKAIHSSSAFPK